MSKFALLLVILCFPNSVEAGTSKLDLQVMLNGADPCNGSMQTISFKIRVYNWETTALAANQLFVEAYVNAPAALQVNSCGQITARDAGGAWQANVGTACSVASITSCSLSPTRQANYKISLVFGAVNIPPNGGYIESDGMAFNLSSWAPFDVPCDDYSKPGSVSWHSDQYWALFQNAPGPTLVCEYSNASTQDPLSGTQACNTTSGCGPAGTPTISPTFSSSPTVTPTNTPCGVQPLIPRMNLQVRLDPNNPIDACVTNGFRYDFKITNVDIMTVDVSLLSIRMWFNDPVAVTLNFENDGTVRTSGGGWLANPASSLAINSSSPNPSCTSGGRNANQTATISWSASSNIPASGGYVDGIIGSLVRGTPFDATCDDYSRLPVSALHTEDSHFALYYNGNLVCEFLNYTTKDTLTGQNPCGNCDACNMPTFTVTPTNTRTATITPTSTPLACTTPQCSTAWIMYSYTADGGGIPIGPGSGYQIPGGLHLTDAAGFQATTAWSNYMLNFGTAFSIQYDMLFSQLGVPNDGADGIAVIFQNDPRGLSAIGAPGQALGYASGSGPNPGINPSLAVEIDTFQNIGIAGDIPWADPLDDHISIHLNGNGDEASAPIPAVPAAGAGVNIEDGVPHRVRIDWNGTNTLQVYFDGVLRQTYVNPNLINDAFGGATCVFWGFGSATGGSVNVHEVLELACGTPTRTPTSLGTPTRTPTPSRTPTPACNASIYNANMESPDGGGPFTDATAYFNWYYYFDGCTTGSWSTAQARSATHSLHSQSFGCGAGVGGYWVQNICGIDTNCDYQFCVWVRSDTSSATSGIFISIEQRNSSGGAVGSAIVDYNISNANGAWVQHCVTITSFGGGFDHLRLVMGNEGEANNAWFDDATFSTVGVCGTPTRSPTRTSTPTPSISPSPSNTRSPTPSVSTLR